MNVSCIFCAHGPVDKIKDVGGYKLVSCPQCDNIFILPRPSLEDLDLAYRVFPFLKEILSKKQAIKIAGEFDKIIKQFHREAKSVLEIGCSTGYILYGLKEIGYDVLGVDFSAEAIRFAQENYHINAVVGDFPSVDKKFDVIIANHVIEHVLQPDLFISKCREYLADNGVLIMATPNVRSVGFKLFGYSYPVVSPPIHLSYFNRNTLSLLVGRYFKVLKIFNSSYVIGRNPFIYNAIISVKNIVNGQKMRATESLGGSSVGGGAKRVVRKLIQIIIAPIFFVFDKIGWGENIVVVARK